LFDPVREAKLPEPEFFIVITMSVVKTQSKKLNFPLWRILRSCFQLSALAIFNSFGSVAKPPNRNY
jgi:hypothetical protein